MTLGTVLHMNQMKTVDVVVNGQYRSLYKRCHKKLVAWKIATTPMHMIIILRRELYKIFLDCLSMY